MAEYIEKEQALMQLTGSFPEDMSLEKYISLVITRLNKLSTADVIERDEYEKIIEENKTLKECITNISNEQLRTSFELRILLKKLENYKSKPDGQKI